MSDKKLFKCQQCDKEYDIPKSLPCGNTVCNACLLKTNDEKIFKCIFCTNDHEIPKDGFPTNVILFQLLSISNESSATVFDKNETLNPSDFDMEKEISEIDSNIKSFKENSNSLIKVKFQEIRDEIIARSEFLAKSLYDYTETVLNDIDLYETELMSKFENSDNFEQKLNDLKSEVETKIDNNSLIDVAKSLNNSVKTETDKISKLNIFDEEMLQYEISNRDLDRELVCKFKLYDEIKFDKTDHKITKFKGIINYKSNDAQAVYDYKNFVSSLDNDKIVVGLNMKIKSTTKPTSTNSTGYCYKLKIIIFNYDGQIVSELPMNNEVHEKFKQLEHFIAHRDYIYCVYVDSNMQYCLKIFNSKFESIKDIKFNSIIKSITINGDSIYVLFNILSVDLYDLNFVKLASFGQLIDESEPFYLESAKEIFIQNDKIYLRLNNDKSIKILERSSGILLKTIEIDLENSILQVNRLSKIVLANRITKKLSIFDENGKLVSENELNTIQNISAFLITSDNIFIFNDFPSRTVYVF